MSGDLNGVAVSPYITNSATAVKQVTTITLDPYSSSGTANILCDGVTREISMTTIISHTLSWSSRGGLEFKPLLQLVANEIAHQGSRSKVLIQMPIQEIGTDPTALNIAGHFQDDLNQYSAVNRKFVFNGHGSYKTRFRRWMIDIMEVIP